MATRVTIKNVNIYLPQSSPHKGNRDCSMATIKDRPYNASRYFFVFYLLFINTILLIYI